MSETSHHIDPPDDDTLAAEFVLGVLSGAERDAARRRIGRDGDFAARVQAWELRLVPWTDEIAPVQPPLEIWNKIAAALPADRVARPRIWGNLALWRSLTVAAAGVAVACLVVMVAMVREPTLPPLQATIEGGGLRNFVATIDPRRGTIAVVPAAYVAAANRVPELWLIAPGGTPKSLGLLNPNQPVVLTIPPSLRGLAHAQATLAVSLEPPGGSTTGAPTGPVIASGKLVNL